MITLKKALVFFGKQADNSSVFLDLLQAFVDCPAGK